MPDIRRLTERFSVAPQVMAEDFAELKRLGFGVVINNRPDGEQHDQISHTEAEAAARAVGLDYIYAPFAGQPTREAVEAVKAALESGKGPVLAHCRSGTRSSHAWAMAAAIEGKLKPDEIIALAASAGYNIAPMKDLLRNLAPQ